MSELDRRTSLHLLHGQMLLMETLGLRYADGEGLARIEEWMDASVSLAAELEDEIIDEGEDFYPADEEEDE